jgi:hypothetical protein
VIYRYDLRRTPCLTYHSISGGLTGGPDVAGSRRAPLLMDRDHLRAMPIKDLTQAYSVDPKSIGSSRVSSVTYRDSWSRLKGEACV